MFQWLNNQLLKMEWLSNLVGQLVEQDLASAFKTG